MTNPYSKIKPYRLMLMNSEGKCVWGASVSPERGWRIKGLVDKDDGINKMIVEESKPKSPSLLDLFGDCT